jgi:hypothetical protein
MSDQEKQILADTVAELILSDAKVRSALYKVVCQCPNLVVQY